MTPPPLVTHLSSLSSPSIPLTCHYPLLQRTWSIPSHLSALLSPCLPSVNPNGSSDPSHLRTVPAHPTCHVNTSYCDFHSFHLSSNVTTLRTPSPGPGHPVIHLHSTEHNHSSVITMLVSFLSATSVRLQGAPRTKTVASCPILHTPVTVSRHTVDPVEAHCPTLGKCLLDSYTSIYQNAQWSQKQHFNVGHGTDEGTEGQCGT